VEALGALPGFGPYTAGAVASIAFALPAPAVDGNVARVLSRLFLVRGAPAGAATRGRVAALARALVRSERPGDLNQALMDLGAGVCGRPTPACGRCPVETLCAARRAGLEREVPAARRRPPRRPLVLGCALVRRGEAILLARRPAGGLFAGLFAPPAAELAPAADPARALARALLDEHALAVDVGDEVAACERTLTHRSLTLRAFRCEPRARVPETAALRFAGPASLARLAVPSAFRALLAAAVPRPRQRRAGRRAAGGAEGR
jgi:A/G-specific adenine glycosylase